MPVTNDELLSYINALNVRVTNLSNSLDATNLTVATNNNYARTNITLLTNDVNSLVSEDEDLHNEIHEVKQDLSYTYTYLTYTTNDVNTLNNSYEVLSYTVDVNKQYMDDEDWELHQEIHEVKQGVYSYISENSDNIFEINQYLTEVPQHVLLSESEWENIGTPDPVKYYFVYEEE